MPLVFLLPIGGRPSIPALKEVINYYNTKFATKNNQDNLEIETIKKEEEKPKNELPDIPDPNSLVMPTQVTNENISDIGSSFFG